jgi:hypothetical protein
VPRGHGIPLRCRRRDAVKPRARCGRSCQATARRCPHRGARIPKAGAAAHRRSRARPYERCERQGARMCEVVVSSRVVSCRLVSSRVVSCRLVSSRVVSCRVVSCRVVSCRVVSCRVVSCRVVPCRAVPCRAVISVCFAGAVETQPSPWSCRRSLSWSSCCSSTSRLFAAFSRWATDPAQAQASRFVGSTGTENR